MGKGGGGGRGKGGCEVLESIHAVACCLCVVLIGGPILIGIGATLLAAATRNDRSRSIDAVQAAVDAWGSASQGTSLQRFSQAAFFAELTPGGGAAPGCTAMSVGLKADRSSSDVYGDEWSRFHIVPQLRYRADLNYSTYMACRYQANITHQVQLPGGRANVSLVALPSSGSYSPTLDYEILLDQAAGSRDCSTRAPGTCASYTTSYHNCRDNCENDFRGVFDCNHGTYTCKLSAAYYSSFAVKVALQAPQDGQMAGWYQLDTQQPGFYGGANVLPYGFIRISSSSSTPSALLPAGDLAPGPVFQLPNLPSPPGTPPASFSLVVRSSSDPWLAYMAVTSGSGYFGVAKRTLVASGVILVVVGCLGTLFWAVTVFWAWRMLCSRRRPTARPAGVGGMAWDLANRYGGQYAPALGVPVRATGHDGLPIGPPYFVPALDYSSLSQPALGQPATGFPCPPGPAGGYPGFPYGASAPGFYPPYGHPGAFAPAVELTLRQRSVGPHEQQPAQQQQPPQQPPQQHPLPPPQPQ